MNISPLLDGAVVTVEITVSSWVISVVFGLVLAGLREMGVWGVDRALSFVVTVVRAIPELVWLYIIFFGIAYLGIRLQSLPAAIIALGISESAFTSEYFRAALMTVPQGQRSAATSLG